MVEPQELNPLTPEKEGVNLGLVQTLETENEKARIIETLERRLQSDPEFNYLGMVTPKLLQNHRGHLWYDNERGVYLERQPQAARPGAAEDKAKSQGKEEGTKLGFRDVMLYPYRHALIDREALSLYCQLISQNLSAADLENASLQTYNYLLHTTKLLIDAGKSGAGLFQTTRGQHQTDYTNQLRSFFDFLAVVKAERHEVDGKGAQWRSNLGERIEVGDYLSEARVKTTSVPQIRMVLDSISTLGQRDWNDKNWAQETPKARIDRMSRGVRDPKSDDINDYSGYYRAGKDYSQMLSSLGVRSLFDTLFNLMAPQYAEKNSQAGLDAKSTPRPARAKIKEDLAVVSDDVSIILNADVLRGGLSEGRQVVKSLIGELIKRFGNKDQEFDEEVTLSLSDFHRFIDSQFFTKLGMGQDEEQAKNLAIFLVELIETSSLSTKVQPNEFLAVVDFASLDLDQAEPILDQYISDHLREKKYAKEVKNSQAYLYIALMFMLSLAGTYAFFDKNNWNELISKADIAEVVGDLSEHISSMFREVLTVLAGDNNVIELPFNIEVNYEGQPLYERIYKESQSWPVAFGNIGIAFAPDAENLGPVNNYSPEERQPPVINLPISQDLGFYPHGAFYFNFTSPLITQNGETEGQYDPYAIDYVSAQIIYESQQGASVDAATIDDLLSYAQQMQRVVPDNPISERWLQTLEGVNSTDIVSIFRNFDPYRLATVKVNDPWIIYSSYYELHKVMILGADKVRSSYEGDAALIRSEVPIRVPAEATHVMLVTESGSGASKVAIDFEQILLSDGTRLLMFRPEEIKNQGVIVHFLRHEDSLVEMANAITEQRMANQFESAGLTFNTLVPSQNIQLMGLMVSPEVFTQTKTERDVMGNTVPQQVEGTVMIANFNETNLAPQPELRNFIGDYFGFDFDRLNREVEDFLTHGDPDAEERFRMWTLHEHRNKYLDSSGNIYFQFFLLERIKAQMVEMDIRYSDNMDLNSFIDKEDMRSLFIVAKHLGLDCDGLSVMMGVIANAYIEDYADELPGMSPQLKDNLYIKGILGGEGDKENDSAYSGFTNHARVLVGHPSYGLGYEATAKLKFAEAFTDEEVDELIAELERIIEITNSDFGTEEAILYGTGLIGLWLFTVAAKNSLKFQLGRRRYQKGPNGASSNKPKKGKNRRRVRSVMKSHEKNNLPIWMELTPKLRKFNLRQVSYLAELMNVLLTDQFRPTGYRVADRLEDIMKIILSTEYDLSSSVSAQALDTLRGTNNFINEHLRNLSGNASKKNLDSDEAKAGPGRLRKIMAKMNGILEQYFERHNYADQRINDIRKVLDYIMNEKGASADNKSSVDSSTPSTEWTESHKRLRMEIRDKMDRGGMNAGEQMEVLKVLRLILGLKYLPSSLRMKINKSSEG